MTLYTDIEPFCCAVLASRVSDGSLPDGDVVMADIHDLGAANLAGYAHIHLFCGIGGMPLGLAWSGWPADRSVLTGGFPCQCRHVTYDKMTQTYGHPVTTPVGTSS